MNDGFQNENAETVSATFSEWYEKILPLMVMAAFKRHLQRPLGFPDSRRALLKIGFILQMIGQKSGPFLEERRKGNACVA